MSWQYNSGFHGKSPKMVPFDGFVVIITGCGGGIGRALAVKFCELGALGLVINDVAESRAKQTAQDLQSVYPHVDIVANWDNVAVASECARMVEAVDKRFGRIDVLVNNAGITRDQLLVKMTDEEWDSVISVNLKGTFNMGRACAPIMIRQKSGRIVNVSSISRGGNIGQSNYSASKAGVVALTKSWALELAKYNVTCNCIAPGFIDTPMLRAIPEKVLGRLGAFIPLKRFGEPSEIANAVAFLASADSSYITGECITLDGGLRVSAGL